MLDGERCALCANPATCRVNLTSGTAFLPSQFEPRCEAHARPFAVPMVVEQSIIAGDFFAATAPSPNVALKRAPERYVVEGRLTYCGWEHGYELVPDPAARDDDRWPIQAMLNKLERGGEGRRPRLRVTVEVLD